jgi:hypothetical protein
MAANDWQNHKICYNRFVPVKLEPIPDCILATNFIALQVGSTGGIVSNVNSENFRIVITNEYVS